MTSMTTADLEQLVEGHDLEAKLAAGRDGRGELPSSFFETYSAFANTDGGIVLLGVEEVPDGRLVAKGMTESAKVVRALWDGLNNPQRVNANLLREQDVETLDVEGKAVIRIAVPRASRRQRPVYVGPNPLTGSFRRNNEGDYRCPEEVVRRMIAEQVEDTRDAHVLRGFGVGDLDATTIAKYRQRYQTRSPDHPWNSLDEKEFLRSVGAFGGDREAGIEGPTSAGLLMFGKLVPIKDAFPNYMLDFQERADARPDSRWVDRLTTDGTWSGNLFDFYALAIQRLFRDLRVPFQLRGDTRIDETPVHEALREALVNTLIHADYTGRVSVLVGASANRPARASRRSSRPGEPSTGARPRWSKRSSPTSRRSSPCAWRACCPPRLCRPSSSASARPSTRPPKSRSWPSWPPPSSDPSRTRGCDR
ncbi:MAG: putative DNA binding domain-containing protein [Proteobacteria bacterium]|nr:putative DNA binding domain-containing protein [Pseudomonadota bacterium]